MALVVADGETAELFFANAFDAVVVARRTMDEAYANLLGLPHATGHRTTMRLGEQIVELLSFDQPGRPYPGGSTSSDLWFQHFAIVVADMEEAYQRLRDQGGFVAISEGGPQTLPPATGSVSAFKFRDGEGHPLELLAFRKGRGQDIWGTKRADALILGIDHSAIAVADTAASLAFFQNGLGLVCGARSENEGIEQTRLDSIPDARVTVIGLDPDVAPPHIELLGYKVGSRRSIDGATSSNDTAATHIVLETSDLDTIVEALTAQRVRFVSPGIVGLADGAEAIMVLDPDGHRFVIEQPVV